MLLICEEINEMLNTRIYHMHFTDFTHNNGKMLICFIVAIEKTTAGDNPPYSNQ